MARDARLSSFCNEGKDDLYLEMPYDGINVSVRLLYWFDKYHSQSSGQVRGELLDALKPTPDMVNKIQQSPELLAGELEAFKSWTRCEALLLPCILCISVRKQKNCSTIYRPSVN